MEITSVNNELVKETVKLQQKKYRDKEQKFILEGDKCVREAFSAGIDIERVFVLQEKSADYSFLQDKLILTNNAVLKKLSTTDTPPDIVAIAKQRHVDKNILKTCRKVVLLENIHDLGNLGTILRTSAAFGADAVVLYGDCADMYNPKCVRSSVGNLWKIPVVQIKEFDELCVFNSFSRIATLPRAKSYLKDFKAHYPCLIMFGSEADGLSDELINFATEEVKIEMSESVESLNLSISCAVVLYKIFAKL